MLAPPMMSTHVISGDQQWSVLARHPYCNFSLVIINGLLASVGGYGSSGNTNSLLSLTGEGGKRQWSEVFPAMPTQRSSTASITTEQALIVAGGHNVGSRLDTVEVMESLQQAQTSVGGGRGEVDSLRGQVRDLQQQNHAMEQDMDQQRHEIEQQRRENEQLHTVHNQVILQVQQLEQQLQGQRVRQRREKFSSCRAQWSEVFPAMLTPRCYTASVTTEALIVAGGGFNGRHLDTVEVMDIPTQQWTTASRLPQPFSLMSATVSGNQLYLAGGRN